MVEDIEELEGSIELLIKRKSPRHIDVKKKKKKPSDRTTFKPFVFMVAFTDFIITSTTTG